MASSIERQQWLENGVQALREHFAGAGYTIPDNVRVSIGFPHGRGGKGKAIGQCWDSVASTDKHHEIFVSPILAISSRVLGVLAHELVHATVGVSAGHKGAFKQCALAIGLEGKMTATEESQEFRKWAGVFVATHGEYPAGALNDATRKKQSTRLLKCECGECGYVARVTSKWIEEAGAPLCPCNQEPMQTD